MQRFCVRVVSEISSLCKTRRLTIEVFWDGPLCHWIVGEGTTIIWNDGNCWPYRTARDRNVFKSSASSLWEPEIWQYYMLRVLQIWWTPCPNGRIWLGEHVLPCLHSVAQRNLLKVAVACSWAVVKRCVDTVALRKCWRTSRWVTSRAVAFSVTAAIPNRSPDAGRSFALTSGRSVVVRRFGDVSCTLPQPSILDEFAGQ